jgi:hypothetical protein
METSICFAGARGRKYHFVPAYVHPAGRELLRTRLRSVLLNGVASPRPPSMHMPLPSRPSAAAELIVGWGRRIDNVRDQAVSGEGINARAPGDPDRALLGPGATGQPVVFTPGLRVQFPRQDLGEGAAVAVDGAVAGSSGQRYGPRRALLRSQRVARVPPLPRLDTNFEITTSFELTCAQLWGKPVSLVILSDCELNPLNRLQNCSRR